MLVWSLPFICGPLNMNESNPPSRLLVPVQASRVGREDRQCLNGHSGRVFWFTGLSGAGKSTLANALEVALHAQGLRTYTLDGDNLRQGLNQDLGFGAADRAENIRRVAAVARLMLDAGLIVMVAVISPLCAGRDLARAHIGPAHFIEVYVDTPLAVCEQRDPKGLYRRARSGMISDMTGISSPYEVPVSPQLVVQTDHQSVEQIVAQLMSFCDVSTDDASHHKQEEG
jgi:bifunctional enzyme CysN/CysC